MQKNPDLLPTWDQFLKPLLELASQGPIMRRTSVQKIAEKYDFSEEIRSSRTKSGQTHIQNRAGWAMSALVKAKFIQKHPTAKFTYQITDKGSEYLKAHTGSITVQDLKNLEGYEAAWKAASRKKQNPESEESPADDSLAQSTPDELIDTAYNRLHRLLADELLENMFAMDPYKFEQLVVDLLFAMGYGGSRSEAAQVTKKSNDEGIDGIINDDRLGLDVIYIQAKRYQQESTIGRKEIQSFVGALAGKQANKGVFITTSSFKTTAIDYAESISQKVILIDGTRLADLMIEHNIGVSTVRTVELKRLDSDYFEG
ncbi:restriction endonuclease [Coraliomargarita sp. SDUM461004]|uniref:Restriction endonuclease n=1 Tax=Thalassobacterium sedimentorum TaxID=3041258 RepID=A0ABU1ANH3_9BACT|nr:restriction endonuclease [Coraliomargarita sp. SDUM461004]MDQ8196352.1 restriction endonuclease [Coraliomargarita sp. SDUM461004]